MRCVGTALIEHIELAGSVHTGYVAVPLRHPAGRDAAGVSELLCCHAA